MISPTAPLISTIRVRLGPRSYDIAITSNDPGGLGPFARQRSPGSVAFVVTDEHVRGHAERAQAALAGAGFHTELAVMPAGEAQKSLASASSLYDLLAAIRADRATAVVAVGGGVIGDLAGFVAATYARGVPLLMVPTTLLAMVDSSVGGKVAINHPRAKNLIGAFHQPIGVWIDTATLATLPDREFRSGLAEVIKYGMALDARLFEEVEHHSQDLLVRHPEVIGSVVQRCCVIKAGVVEADERDTRGRRAILNYGHTFAHAFETITGYGCWLHGEAVAAGMGSAARLACARGLISPEVVHRQQRLLGQFGLPTRPPAIPAEEILSAMRGDKKASRGRLAFILPRRIGEAALYNDVSEAEVRRVLDEDSARVSHEQTEVREVTPSAGGPDAQHRDG